MTGAYKLLMQLHGYVNKAVCIFLAVLNALHGPWQHLCRYAVALAGIDSEAGSQGHFCVDASGSGKSSCL